MNMKLIEPNDPLYFTVTSDGEYDRHTYELVSPDNKRIKFENWSDLQQTWFEQVRNWSGWTVTVLDKKKKSKGF